MWPGPAGAAQVPVERRGLDLAAGGLLLLLAVLFVVGSFLTLVEYDHRPTQPQYNHRPIPSKPGDLLTYHQVWQPWKFTSSGMRNFPAETQQLLGIAMIVAAVFATLGGILLLTGLARRYPPARAITVSAASSAVGSAAALLVLVGSALINTARGLTVRLESGYWVFAFAAIVSMAALVGVLVGSGAAQRTAPVDRSGRPLTPRAGALDIVVGMLLVVLAGLAVASSFGHLLGNTTMWRTFDGTTRMVGLPVAVGAVVALVAAVLSFTGRGRIIGSASAAALFGTGLLLSLDLVDRELFGPVGFGDLGVSAWLLFAATALALLVTVLAVASAATKPRYRTPYAPPPNWGRPPQSPVPAQSGWPQVPPGWVLVPESSVQQPGPTPQQ
ncbi:hypothetical protein [Nocardia heshunensis]